MGREQTWFLGYAALFAGLLAFAFSHPDTAVTMALVRAFWAAVFVIAFRKSF